MVIIIFFSALLLVFILIKKRKNSTKIKNKPFGQIKTYEYHKNKNTYDIFFDDNYEKCEEFNKHINIIFLADTHGELLKKEEEYNKLKQFINDGCDVIISLGDVRQDELEILCELNNDKYPILAVKGNHDELNQFDNFPNIIDINNKLVEINGVKFIGLEGSIKYKEYSYPSYTQEESLIMVDDMPAADILISHAKCWVYDDINMGTNCHVGLIGNTKYLLKNRCSLNFHGHNHKQYETEIHTLSNGSVSYGVYLVEKISI